MKKIFIFYTLYPSYIKKVAPVEGATQGYYKLIKAIISTNIGLLRSA